MSKKAPGIGGRHLGTGKWDDMSVGKGEGKRNGRQVENMEALSGSEGQINRTLGQDEVMPRGTAH